MKRGFSECSLVHTCQTNEIKYIFSGHRNPVFVTPVLFKTQPALSLFKYQPSFTEDMHKHTYIYVYMCVCACVCARAYVCFYVHIHTQFVCGLEKTASEPETHASR